MSDEFKKQCLEVIEESNRRHEEHKYETIETINYLLEDKMGPKELLEKLRKESDIAKEEERLDGVFADAIKYLEEIIKSNGNA